MSRLSLLDLAFFIAETEASPKHVGGVHVLAPPAGSKAGFAKTVYEDFLTHTEVQAPFNRVIDFVSRALTPSWTTVEAVDLAEHVFFHKLKPGANQRDDLYALVARLHEPMLDRSRPLWEVHVIAGLWDKQFAVYYKMHHAYADGITMTRWGVESMRKSADDTEVTPVWSLDHTARRKGGRLGQGRKLDPQLAATAWKQITLNSKRAAGIGRLTAMLMLEAVKLTKNAIALPFMASGNTPFTGNATPGRQFATAAVPMARIDAIRDTARATLNHVALTCLDGAMHRYLADEGITLDRPITIQMPVNLRRPGEKAAGNKIGIILVDLSPPTDDAYVRLRNVGYSLRNVRHMVDSVSPEAIETYTILTGLFGQFAGTFKLADVITPMGNTLVSNVPGPAERLYLKGAELREMHPVSTLPATHLLNITLFSYAGTLYFGLIATDALPNLARLAGYVEEEIAALEAAVGVA
jgi:diacylglycerol O-acyltransferase / wax synthase